MNTESWEPIEGLEGYYEVSSLGRIRSLPHHLRRNAGKVLKPIKNNKGYWIVRYRKGQSRAAKAMIIHRQMAIAFLPNINNLTEVNHKDGDKDNNLLDNLEWTTRSDNVRHAFANGLVASGEARKSSKLSDKSVREIRLKYRPRTYSQYQLAREYGVSQSTIRFVLIGKTWKGVM